MRMMGMIWIALVMSWSVATAQEKTIVKVGAGEYFTTYLTADGKLFATAFKAHRYVPAMIPVDKVMDVDGAQYTNIVLDSSGMVYIAGVYANGVLYAKKVLEDAEGNVFDGNSKVYGWYQGYLTLRDGKIWMWGEDLLNLNHGGLIDRPVPLYMPEGKSFTKLVPMTMGLHSLMGLAEDGTVWIWEKGKRVPNKVPINQRARDIAGVGAACYVVETNFDLYAWGYLGSYLGAPDLSTKPVSIKKAWVAAGCKFPSRELIGNYNTLHIIDSENDMFGAGENVMGEIGNGKQHPDWRNYSPTPFAWNWQHRQLISKPVQIPGKFKNLCTGNTITFYFYVQDEGNNWYSWGRNKARCLGNGITLTVNGEAQYPNARNVPAPARVEPLKTRWKILNFHIDSIIPPLANAGINQYITSPTTFLNGNLSSQDGGRITAYQWEQTDGSAVIIENPHKSITKISGLYPGTYRFKLTVTSSNHQTAEDEITVVMK